MNRITFRHVAALGLLTLCFAVSPSSAKSVRKSPQMDDPGAPAVLALGSPAPMSDVKMKNIDGKDITLAGAAGKKGLLVVFTCNHCPWAKAWQDRIAALGNAAADSGVGVVAVNSNDPKSYPEDGFEEMQKRAKSVGFKFAYVVDATSDVARAFGASHTPEAYLFDAKGKLVYHGAVDDNAQEPAQVKSHWLKDAVTAVASGQPVAVAQSKAMGCGIKYRQKS
jgi:peroxiredoxin